MVSGSKCRTLFLTNKKQENENISPTFPQMDSKMQKKARLALLKIWIFG